MRPVSSPCLTVKGSARRVVQMQSNQLLKRWALFSTLTSTPCTVQPPSICLTMEQGMNKVVTTKNRTHFRRYLFRAELNAKTNLMIPERWHQADKHIFSIRDHRVNVRWAKKSTINVLHCHYNRGPDIRQLFMPLQKVSVRTLASHVMPRQRLYPDDFDHITIFARSPPGVSWKA